MFKASISVLPLSLVRVSCATAQTPTLASTPDAVYLAAVREFARDMVEGRRALDDSTRDFFLEDSIDAGSHLDFLTSCLQDSSFFTPLERKQIKRWASRPYFRLWTKGMVPGVRLIPEDTISAIFSWKHGDGWEYFNLHYGSGFHSFGCPLFMRDYTWCLFYSGHHCGWLCGDGQLVLYKKVGGRWVFVKNWGEWMS